MVPVQPNAQKLQQVKAYLVMHIPDGILQAPLVLKEDKAKPSWPVGVLVHHHLRPHSIVPVKVCVCRAVAIGQVLLLDDGVRGCVWVKTNNKRVGTALVVCDVPSCVRKKEVNNIGHNRLPNRNLSPCKIGCVRSLCKNGIGTQQKTLKAMQSSALGAACRAS